MQTQKEVRALDGHHLSQSIFRVSSYPFGQASTRISSEGSHKPPNSRFTGSIHNKDTNSHHTAENLLRTPLLTPSHPDLPKMLNFFNTALQIQKSLSFPRASFPLYLCHPSCSVPSPANSFSKMLFFHEELTG